MCNCYNRTMNELLLLSGRRLAELIRKREVSSYEVVKIHIEHIKKVNPILNAIVKDRFESALKEAKGVDEHLKSDPENVPLYYGVPCTIKETFSLKGMPNSGGLYLRKGVIAEKDATCVKRLKDAGAIPLGVTNIPELAMWMESYNVIYGRTNNAYDPRRTSGGSSGGEGAIIGAGGSPFGLGSDLGGSIRMPSFFNGIFGHKPSSGLVPNTGQFPATDGEALRFLSPGPMTRSSEDLFPLLKIIAGPDGEDSVCRNMELKNPEDVKIEEIKVYSIEDNGKVNVSEDLKDAQRRCVQFLRRKGVYVKEIRIKELKHSLFIWSSMLTSAQEKTFKELMGGGKPLNGYKELLKWIFGISQHTLPGIFLTILEDLNTLTPKLRKKFIKIGEELREKFINILGCNGVILYPPYSRPAPFHNQALFKPFDWVYTAIFNVLGFPVTQVPLGLNKDGIPLGLQVVGAPGNDHLTIKLAIELEKKFGGWIPPPWVQEIT